MTVAGIEGINAILDAAKERFSESQREKAAGSAVWWRVSRQHYFLRAIILGVLIPVQQMISPYPTLFCFVSS